MAVLQSVVRRRPEPAGVQPLPMAIAVHALPAAVDDATRHLARLDLVLHAYKLGYFVLDVFEVPPGEPGPLHAWIEVLAEQTDADAFVCRGAVDREWIEAVAARIHMTCGRRRRLRCDQLIGVASSHTRSKASA